MIDSIQIQTIDGVSFTVKVWPGRRMKTIARIKEAIKREAIFESDEHCSIHLNEGIEIEGINAKYILYWYPIY